MVDRSGKVWADSALKGRVQFQSFLFILSSPGDRLSPGKGANGVNCSEAIRQIWLHHSPTWNPSRAPLLPSGSRPVPWYGLLGPSSPGFGGPLLPLALSSLPTSTLFSTFLSVWKVHSPRQEHHLYTLWCVGSKTLSVSSGDWIYRHQRELQQKSQNEWDSPHCDKISQASPTV